MSEIFRPYERLVEITIFGKKFQVPAKAAKTSGDLGAGRLDLYQALGSRSH